MPKKNSAEYWEERIANKTWKVYNSIEEKNIALLELYQDAGKSIKDELYAIAEKYSKDGVLTLSDMHKQNRLTKLNKSMENIVKRLGEQTEDFAKENMQEGFNDTYSNVRASLGDIDFAMPNKKLMVEMLERPWLGNDFSGRLWENQKRLAMALNDQFLTGLQQGRTATEMAVGLNNIMGKGFNNAHRLVRTETMHYLNNAALQGYRDSGCDKVQLWAAIDERTCDTCGTGGYHEKIYDIEKAPILPLHANCRCTYLPVVEGEGIKLGDTTDKWGKEAKSELLKDEKSRSTRKKEASTVYGPDGKYLFQKRGSETEVIFSKKEVKLLVGAVVTHNHPSGGSFSCEDIQFLRKSGAAEVRVSTDSESYYLRPPDKWEDDINTREKLKEAYISVKKELRDKYQMMYNEGKIDKIQRNRMWRDEVNKIFAERYGMTYGKETFE